MERRSFIKHAALGAVMPSLINGQHVKAVGLSPWLESITNTNVETDHVLVVIQLNGGNDGLNMVMPLDQYTNLAAARGNILVNENQVLRLNGSATTGLHPAMTGLKDMYNAGKLNIIQSVGYPQPNFSHFRATDIWLTASNAREVLVTGWAGRYLGTEYPNYPTGYPNQTMPDPLAIQITSNISSLLEGPTFPMGVTVTNPNDFYNFVNNVQDPAPQGYAGRELTYIRTIARQAKDYGDVVRAAFTRGGAPTVAYPPTTDRNNLAEQLKIVAQLIKGGLKTRVYVVSIGGFDTHSAQVVDTDHTQGTHATLMKNLSNAIASFQADLEARRVQDRVLGMTFSEFGRRIKSNASLGTDHGAAAPMFVFGTRLFGGILGNSPTISATTAANANLPMQYDFRSVYASILKDWFCVPDSTIDSAILLRNFQRLRIVNSPSCITPTHEDNQKAGISLVEAYPNPFDWATTIEFETVGGHTMVQIFNALGELIAVPVDADYVGAGKHKVRFEAPFLPSGVYYVRLQNGGLQQVKPLMKVR